MTADERWADIPGYEGLYQISSRARVKSLARSVTRNDGYSYHIRTKVLRSYRHKPSAVRSVSLCRDGHSRRFYVHKLVEAAFGTTT